MADWTKVVTDPLGLGGFALFLFFAYIGHRRKSGQQDSWTGLASYSLAVIALLGGLILAYQKEKRKPDGAGNVQNMKIGNVDQQSQGGSNVTGVQGDVSVGGDSAKNSKPVSGQRIRAGNIKQDSKGKTGSNVAGVQGSVTAGSTSNGTSTRDDKKSK